jgi:hypothetical protein
MRMGASMKNSASSRLDSVTAKTFGVTGAIALSALSADQADAGVVDFSIGTLGITELGLTADKSSVFFDLDGNGTDDFKVTDQGAKGSIKGLDNFDGNGSGTKARILVNKSKIATSFDYGDVVEKGSPALDSAALHNDFQKGYLIPQSGDSTYIGLLLGSFEEGEFTQVNYGWVEITRGSVILGTKGYQTAANIGAPIITSAPVPVPPSLALLATGALGIGALSRRRKSRT